MVSDPTRPDETRRDPNRYHNYYRRITVGIGATVTTPSELVE